MRTRPLRAVGQRRTSMVLRPFTSNAAHGCLSDIAYRSCCCVSTGFAIVRAPSACHRSDYSGAALGWREELERVDLSVRERSTDYRKARTLICRGAVRKLWLFNWHPWGECALVACIPLRPA